MNLLPDDFWDEFAEEGGWPQFILAFLVFVALLAVMTLGIYVFAPQ